MKDDKKEELYQKFEASMKFWIDKKSIDQHSLDASFDFFYAEIEAREELNQGYEYEIGSLKAKRDFLTELLKAADEVIKASYNMTPHTKLDGKTWEHAFSDYQTLKNKQ